MFSESVRLAGFRIPTTVGVMALTVCGRAVAFLIPFFVVAWYGVNRDTDAFFLAYGLATFVIVVLNDLAEAMLVPLIAQRAAAGGERSVGPVLWQGVRYATIAAVIPYVIGLGLLALAGASAGAPLASPLGSRFDWSLTQRLLGYAGPMILLAVLAAVPGAALLARGHFLLPTLATGIRGIVTLGVLFLVRQRAATVTVMLAYLAGELARFVVVAAAAWHRHLTTFPPPGADPALALPSWRTVAGFQAAALVLASTNPLVARLAATHLAPGSVALVELGEKIFWIPMMAFYAAISTVGLSQWANTYYAEGHAAARRRIGTALRQTIWWGAAATLITILLAEPFARLMLREETVAALGRDELRASLRLYGAGVLPFAMLMAVQRSLLVVRETRQIFWAGAAGSVGNVLLLLVLAPRWHVPGIALATTLTHVVSLVMAGAFAHRRWNER